MAKYKADITKLANKRYRRILLTALILVLSGVLLTFVLRVGGKAYPLLLAVGAISFAICFVFVFIISLVYAVVWDWYMVKHHFDLWKRWVVSHLSLKERCEVSKLIRSLRDPFLIRAGVIWKKVGLLALLTWLLLFLLISSIAIVDAIHP